MFLTVALFGASLNGQGAGDGSGQPTDVLAADQGNVANKYTRLEKLMFRMAEYDANENPSRAALLRKAIALSKEKHIRLQMETLVGLLNQDKLNRALDNQKELSADLTLLLELLSSEDRSEHIKDQRRRYESYIKEIDRILRQQRDVQGRTEGGVDAKRMADAQQRIAERTAKLDNRIADENSEQNSSIEDNSGDGDTENERDNGHGADADERETESDRGADGASEAAKDGSSEDDSGKSTSNDGSPADSEDKDSEDKDRKDKDRKDGDRKDGDRKAKESPDEDSEREDSENGNSQEKESGDANDGDVNPSSENRSDDGSSKADESQPGGEGESQPGGGQGQSSRSNDEPPARKRLQAAEQKMREAQLRLEEARRDDAAEAQEQARRELEAAKAELEEILRQLREEEIERTLALLESRFRRMLEMQMKVYEDTMRLDRIPLDRRDRHVDLEATKLSFQERRIVLEADKALALLQEEGSSVAFPESVEQMRGDMEQAVERLAQVKIGRLTQGLEEDIIESLDEMVAAMQKAQMDQQQQQMQQQQQQQQTDEQEQPLVDQIAELRMLKALQIRINKRTTRYSNLLDDVDDDAGQASDDELVAALQRLADREARLHEITRDLVVGKNQ